MMAFNLNKTFIAFTVTLLIFATQTGCSLFRAKEYLGNYLGCITTDMTIYEMESKCLPLINNKLLYFNEKKYNIMLYADIGIFCGIDDCYPNNLPSLLHEKKDNVGDTIVKEPYVQLKRYHPLGLKDIRQNVYVFYDPETLKIIGWISGGSDAVKIYK